jgi:hypothetical protein
MKATDNRDTDMRNATNLEFEDISTEQFREYVFPDGEVVRIDSPLKLHVSDSDAHRVFDAEGESHYIPPKWIHLRWKTKDGEPHFVK